MYASGDLFIYLEEGNPRNRVAPDAFVVLGAANRRRETYRLWEEPAGVPDFVLELVSPSTWRTDVGAKREKYAALGVREYWLHDPHGRHLQPALAGYLLDGSAYVPLPAIQTPAGIAMRSDVLGLELHLDGDDLRLFDPVSGEHIPNFAESEAGRRIADAGSRAAEARGRAVEADLRAAKTRTAELERALRQRRGE
ncbi:MAG: Uma2 family endonuclease [Gammaproteobacteria bacterium]|nr:Uma2 family endonuclease [Gammaproteobacteria bacterium]